MSTRNTILTVAVLGSFASIASAAPIIIDDFTQSTAPGYPVVRTTVDAPNIYPGIDDPAANVPGGVRGVGINGVSFDVPTIDDARALVSTLGTGIADYQSSSGTVAYLGLFYGTTLFNPPGPLNLDYSSVVSFDVEFLSYDAPANSPLTVTVALLSGAGSTSVNGIVTSSGAQTLSISTAGVNPAILADVDGIAFLFTSPKAADFRLNTLSAAIPEPSALSLLALPAALLTRRRK